MAPTSKFIKYGAPMILFCVVGLQAMSKFVGGRVEASDQRVKKRSERAVELEQAHKAIVDKLELSDYEIKPIPRPVDK